MYVFCTSSGITACTKCSNIFNRFDVNGKGVNPDNTHGIRSNDARKHALWCALELNHDYKCFFRSKTMCPREKGFPQEDHEYILHACLPRTKWSVFHIHTFLKHSFWLKWCKHDVKIISFVVIKVFQTIYKKTMSQIAVVTVYGGMSGNLI